MKRYVAPEIRIAKFSSEFIGTTEATPDPLATPVNESSFTTGAQKAFTVISGSGTTDAMQKSVNFQDAMKYK